MKLLGRLVCLGMYSLHIKYNFLSQIDEPLIIAFRECRFFSKLAICLIKNNLTWESARNEILGPFSMSRPVLSAY